MIADILSLIEFLKKNWRDYETISTLFSWNGQRIKGDRRILVDIINVEGKEDQWFYRIKELKNYVFVIMPVIPVYIDYGIERGDKNPDAKFFRFVTTPLSSVISGGSPNVKVDFMVIGYNPENLLMVNKEKNL